MKKISLIVVVLFSLVSASVVLAQSVPTNIWEAKAQAKQLFESADLARLSQGDSVRFLFVFFILGHRLPPSRERQRGKQE